MLQGNYGNLFDHTGIIATAAQTSGLQHLWELQQSTATTVSQIHAKRVDFFQQKSAHLPLSRHCPISMKSAEILKRACVR